MAGYISARFEHDALPTSNQVRVIARNVDQGTVPPVPNATYFPTDPDDLRAFMVLEYVSDVIGERYVRVATLEDISLYSTLALDTFEDLSADFVAGSVAAGDVLEITQPDSELWNSEEYPATVFQFAVSAVLSATQLTVVGVLPAFQSTLSWSIAARSLTGTDGVTRRNGSPVGGTLFRAPRFARYFPDAVVSANYITAVKAGMTSLAVQVSGEGLTAENFTASPA